MNIPVYKDVIFPHVSIVLLQAEALDPALPLNFSAAERLGQQQYLTENNGDFNKKNMGFKPHKK